ncbi:RICIN domain-containing protein [Fluviispira sanaruensis]
MNNGTGKCLDVSNHSTADGANIQILECTGALNQI